MKSNVLPHEFSKGLFRATLSYAERFQQTLIDSSSSSRSNTQTYSVAAAVFLAVIVLTCLSPAHSSGQEIEETAPASVVSADPSSETPLEEPVITESDRDHWSLKPRVRVELPTHAHGEWTRNGIDDFIAATLQKQSLSPQPEASRQTLIRRVTLDITGLLPSLTEASAYLQDESPAAFETVVHRLLASSAYGERWAQHWLDLARFAETDGFEHDTVRPEAWRYRDWVIDALNDDLPYDRFVQMQIAGDLIQPGSEAAAATQFCLSGPDMRDLNSQEERRHTLLNEMTATVSEVMLGLQIGCAQCHDHKYDPVSQADFYRLRAIFESCVHVTKNVSVSAFDEDEGRRTVSRVMLRGDFRRPGSAVEPGVPRVLNSDELRFPLSTAGAGAGRVALANWLTSPHNPLTARVIVNRVWQQHFGIGLCETASDFGVMGQEPVNAALLDWLANWFIDHEWSLKQLHRLIVTSATYRQRSFLSDDAPQHETAQWAASLKQDLQVRLLSRFPRQRLQGEQIRDILLQVAGQLNHQAGGPGIRPPLPEELRAALLKDQWTVTEDVTQHNRRSIYVFARRNLRLPMFEVFDRPSANGSCSGRTISTTAPQALHLMNSDFSFRLATALAQQVCGQTTDFDEQVVLVFQRILGRRPEPEEQVLIENDESQTDSDEFLSNLCLTLFNCNEFVFVD